MNTYRKTLNIKYNRAPNKERTRMLDHIKACIFICACTCIIGALFWHGMNKELCNRDYPEALYNEMQLDCS